MEGLARPFQSVLKTKKNLEFALNFTLAVICMGLRWAKFAVKFNVIYHKQNSPEKLLRRVVCKPPEKYLNRRVPLVRGVHSDY